MKRFVTILFLAAFLVLTGSLSTAQAQVPARISYQGLVLDQNQAALADGAYRVTFRLYADEDAPGQALWSETQTVSVEGGLLSTMIGAERALNLPFDQPYFLSVEIEGQPESQRMALSSAAYAFLARDVPDSTVVRSISGLQDTVELVAGDGISIQQRGNRLIISAEQGQGLPGYGPGERDLEASIKSPMTEEEDEEAVKALLETLGEGGSNVGLDKAYDDGRIVTLDDGRIVFQNSSTNIGFELLNARMYLNNQLGGGAQLLMGVGGVSSFEIWRMVLDASSGALEFRNTTVPTSPATTLRMTDDATDGLMTLDGSAVELRNASGANTITFDTDLAGDGRVTTEELEITGGSDLSENFDVSGGYGVAAPEPGMVVSIDPSNPGRLTVSGTPYDRMVAGVVSGAGGIETGLIMGQEGSVADGAVPVALTGRVYVWGDASYGAISPGDLLTTSSTAGHAMKVDDYARSQGAILGKAMTSLPEGRGLVLMLVTLQ